jgi:hypothetical protein
MPLIKFKIIDGVKVVQSFKEPNIDPEATKKKLIAELEKSDEWDEYQKTLQKVTDQIRTTTVRRADVEGTIKRAGNGQGSAIVQKRKAQNVNEYQKCNAEIQRYHDILAQSLEALNAKREQLLPDCTIRLSGGGYEQVDSKTCDKLKDAYKALRPRQYLTSDGTVIDDLRQTIYVAKIDGLWKSGKIEKLGEKLPNGAKSPDRLTEVEKTEIMNQARREWVAGLDHDDRKKLKADELDNARLAAATQRSAFELEHSDDEAKKMAQEWLAAEKAKIEELYDVA